MLVLLKALREGVDTPEFQPSDILADHSFDL
jgi:hypothetical protein